LGAWGLLLVAPALAAAQAVGYTGSLYAAQGRSPTERTDSVYVFAGIDAAAGPARLTLSVPFVRTVTTPEDSAAGETGAAAATTTGVADPLLRLDVRVWNHRARALQVGAAAAVKLPVVDAATGRGTGEADYAVGASAFTAAGRTSFLADVLYWQYGDPDGVDFANTWSYSFGAARIIGRGRVSALGSISGFSSGIAGEPAPVSLNIGFLSLVGRGQSLAVSASVGLTDSASDFSVGTSWRIAR